jgi:hypothetical protein
MLLLKIYIAGLVVLFAAVILNLLANVLGVATWYSFLAQAGQQGFVAAVRSLNGFEIVFLAMLYPFLLGLAAYETFSLTAQILR